MQQRLVKTIKSITQFWMCIFPQASVSVSVHSSILVHTQLLYHYET